MLLNGIPKPFEILFGFLFLFVLFELATSAESRSLLRNLKSIWILYGTLLGVLYIFVFIGGASSFPEWALYAPEVYLGYASIALSFLIFFVSIYIVIRYKMSLYWGLLAMTVSPLVLFAAFVPKWQDFFVENARLIGAQNDPNITASFIAVGLLISSVFYLYDESRLRWLGGLYVALSMPLFLWANSRGAIFSIAVVLALLSTLYFFRGLSWRRTGAILVLFGIFVLSVPAALLVLPKDSRVSIYQGFIAPVLPSESLREFVVENWISEGDSELRTAVLRDISIDSFSLSRGSLWSLAFEKTIKSPLGFGPAYHKWNPVERGTGAHNLWLQIPLTAGWGGFLLWLVFLGAVFREMFQIMKSESFIGTALSVGLVFLLINGIFIDIFTLRWMWLIIGMTVGYSFLKNNETAKSISNSPDT